MKQPEPTGKTDIRTQNAQLGLLLILGLIYVFLIPPFEAPDEAAHFFRAYGVAEGQLILRDHPLELLAFYRDEVRKRDDPATTPFLAKLDQLLDGSDERIPNLAFNTSLYSPVPYVFHALVLRMAMLGNSSPQVMLYLCRFFSLLLFVTVLSLSFTIFPAGRWPLFWVAATPMALSQAAVINIDYVVLGTTILLTAVSLGDSKKWMYTCCLGFSGFFLVTAKLPYLPVLMLPLVAAVIKKQYHLLPVAAGSVVVALLGAALWQYCLTVFKILDSSLHIVATIFDIDIALNPQDQLYFILSAPWQYGMVLLNTVLSHGLTYFHQFVGVLGALDIPVPAILAAMWVPGGLVVIWAGPAPPDLNSKTRFKLGLTCLFLGLSTALAIVTAAYLLWMPVGATEVNLQGRYFHAVMILLLAGGVMLRPAGLMLRCSSRLQKAVILLGLIINGGAFITLVQQYGLNMFG